MSIGPNHEGFVRSSKQIVLKNAIMSSIMRNYRSKYAFISHNTVPVMQSHKLYIRSTFNFDGFPEYAKSLGADTDSLRDELGLQKDRIREQANIVPWNAVCTFYERAAAQIGDESLGLRFALNTKADFSSIGPTIYIGALSEDIKSFFDYITEAQSIRTNGIDYSFHDNIDEKELAGIYKIHPSSAPYRQFLESTIAIAAITAQKLIPSFKVKYISLMHQGPSDRSIYEEVFKAPVYFGQKENKLVSNRDYFELEDNRLSVGFRDFALKAFFKGRTELKPDARRSVAKFVETVLPSVMGLGLSDIESFSKSLNMHPKKLQRLLKEEDQSYSNVVDIVRKTLSESYLNNTSLSIGQIAALLEYSSDRPFSTAFKRWYDVSPTQFRKNTEAEKDNSELFFLS